MAKARINSKKGGASSHLRPCKVAYCDKHNERLDENPSNKNIRPEFSTRNSVWKDPDVLNLVTLDRQIRKDYFIHNNRHMPNRGPSKASPLKESVTLMPNGDFATDEIQKKIVARIEKEFGIRCVRLYNHRDEYCDETGEYNWHGHEVWDMYDHENHRMVALSRADCRKWQDIVAEETGMPRGNPAYETRRKWLTANEYKIKQQNESIAKKKADLEEMNALVEQKAAEVEALKIQVRKKEEELAKTTKSPLARVIAGVKTKMAGNYTQEEVDEMMTKANADADERVRAIQEQSDKKIDEAWDYAKTLVSSLESQLENARRTLMEERKEREDIIRKAVDDANRKARAYFTREMQDGIARTTADVQKQLKAALTETATLRSQIGELKATYHSTTTIAHAFVNLMKDVQIKGSQRNDVLALFADHLDENGRKVVGQILSGNGIFRTIRTTAELEKYRQQVKKEQSQTKKYGRGI